MTEIMRTIKTGYCSSLSGRTTLTYYVGYLEGTIYFQLHENSSGGLFSKEWVPDVRMHDLRHSMASNMVNSGRSIYEVATVLGHSQLKTSQRYAHLSQETLLAAVDAAAAATGMGQV